MFSDCFEGSGSVTTRSGRLWIPCGVFGDGSLFNPSGRGVLMDVVMSRDVVDVGYGFMRSASSSLCVFFWNSATAQHSFADMTKVMILLCGMICSTLPCGSGSALPLCVVGAPTRVTQLMAQHLFFRMLFLERWWRSRTALGIAGVHVYGRGAWRVWCSQRGTPSWIRWYSCPSPSFPTRTVGAAKQRKNRKMTVVASSNPAFLTSMSWVLPISNSTSQHVVAGGQSLRFVEATSHDLKSTKSLACASSSACVTDSEIRGESVSDLTGGEVANFLKIPVTPA